MEGPELQPGWGPAIFPWQIPLPWARLFPCSPLFPPHFLTETGAEGSVDGLGRTGGDTGLSQQAIVTLQPGWAQEAPSVTEPPGGSSLIKGCRS